MNKISIAIHAGASEATEITRLKKTEIMEALQQSVNEGYKLLTKGAPAFEAVAESIRLMEDCPWFNAGKGSAITNKGTIEMHSCIMDGNSLKVGAVASVSKVRNPILLALEIMKKSKNCFLCDEGAEEFAKENKLQFEGEDYFFTDHQLKYWKEKESKEPSGHGTVGCVALDLSGNLAAGTSTGGLLNAASRRVSDSAIAGASTYANNKTCSVCCTGDGEVFIKSVLAKTISDLIEFKGISLEQAIEIACNGDLNRFTADVGIIAIDTSGKVESYFNTEKMYRGWKNSNEDFIGIY
jgi:beta-aspartyl-peptidase (threonine type)